MQATQSQDIASTWIVGQRKTKTNNTETLWINNSILKIREKSYPVMEVSLKHYGRDTDLMDFSWECTQLNDDTMTLQLDFKNPGYISTGYRSDILNIVFYDNSFFLG